jgi:hypothetical protein
VISCKDHDDHANSGAMVKRSKNSHRICTIAVHRYAIESCGDGHPTAHRYSPQQLDETGRLDPRQTTPGQWHKGTAGRRSSARGTQLRGAGQGGWMIELHGLDGHLGSRRDDSERPLSRRQLSN